MNEKWNELYNAAKKVLRPREVSKIIEAGGVAAAVESVSGNIYAGGLPQYRDHDGLRQRACRNA